MSAEQLIKDVESFKHKGHTAAQRLHDRRQEVRAAIECAEVQPGVSPDCRWMPNDWLRLWCDTLEVRSKTIATAEGGQESGSTATAHGADTAAGTVAMPIAASVQAMGVVERRLVEAMVMVTVTGWFWKLVMMVWLMMTW